MATKKTAETDLAAGAEAVTGKDTVVVHLFKDNQRYKDDVFVGLNGRYYQIKRGVDVEVPRGVAEILERSMAQDQATADMTEQLQSDYEAKAKAVGV